MASRWYVLLERIGKRQRLPWAVPKSCRSNATGNVHATATSGLRKLCTHCITPTATNRSGGSTQMRDRQIYHLTQLFGKLLKSGEDRKAAELLDGITSLQSPATVAVCNYLLNSCSKSRNAEMAKEVWSIMKTNGVQMNEVSHGCMLCALSRGGNLEEAVDLLHLLHKSREANVVMYNTVLNGCVQAKSTLYAAQCLELMEAQGIARDEISYMELIKLSGMCRDLTATKKWWKELVQNFVPSPTTHSPYIIALSRMNMLTEAHQEIRNMVSDLGLERETKPLDDEKHVSDQASSELLFETGREAQMISFKLNLPQRFFRKDFYFHGTRNQEQSWRGRPSCSEKELGGNSLFSTEIRSLGLKLPSNMSTTMENIQNAYNSLINAAGKAGDHKLAESLFTEMRELGLKRDIYTYNALLRAVVEGRGVQHALRILRKMEASGPPPDVYSLTALLTGYCKSQQLDTAENVLKCMESGGHKQKPTCYSFNILLKACAVEEDPARALRVFARMKESGVAPDICTYIALFTACVSTKAGITESNQWSQQEVAKRVTAIEMDMAQSGVPHTHETLTSLMRLLGDEGLMEAMLWRLQDATNDGRNLLDAKFFNTVILSCFNAKKVETGWEIYYQMKAAGVKPDVYTYNILINGCALDKDMHTAFELVENMHRGGLHPDIVTFNSLLKVVCHCGAMDTVLDFLQNMTASGVQPDSATFNTILTSASYHKRLDVTEQVLEKMLRQNVLPDQHTLLPVVSIYMQLGQTNNAVEALHALSLRMLDWNSKQQSELKHSEMWKDASGLLMDATLHTSPDSLVMYTAALAGLIHDDNEVLVQKQSSWADRLSTRNERRKTLQFAKSDEG